MTPKFQEWPKIARLNRDIIITEKLDGTNAAIGIYEEMKQVLPDTPGLLMAQPYVEAPTGNLIVYAQSRTRIITPGKHTDNYGFAAWVEENAQWLKLLGPGLHFGEWWGQGIQRNYGLKHRTFSLFNTRRWIDDPEQADVLAFIRNQGVNIDVVPVLYKGPRIERDTGNDAVGEAIASLQIEGSRAVPGFMKPEGIVVFHTAAQIAFKVTCENDAQHKGEVNRG